MNLLFQQEYVVGIVAFMLILFFCKTVLECIQTVLKITEQCAISNCMFCPSVDYLQAENLISCSVCALIVCTLFQSIILIVMNYVGTHINDNNKSWQVTVLQFHMNNTQLRELSHTNNNFTFQDTEISKTFVTFNIVDALMLIMPFALMSVANCWLWVSMQHHGVIPCCS